MAGSKWGRRRGGIKVSVILLGLAVCCFLLLGAIANHLFTGDVSSDPDKIDAVRNEMATLAIPPGFMPLQYANFHGIRCVGYLNPTVDATILLMQVPPEQSDHDLSAKQDIAEEQSQLDAGFQRLENVEGQRKLIKIKGKECPFQFTRGIDPKTQQQRERIAGIFEGKTSPITLIMDLDPSAYHEDQILKMLEGIH